MITLNFPQGSIDWITSRLWRLTASDMKANITATGSLSRSEPAMRAIDKLIAGLDLAAVIQATNLENLDDRQLKTYMAHWTGDKFMGSVHTERGKDVEADALAALSEAIGENITDVGMCVMGDNVNGVVSCSPDGLIYKNGKLYAGCEVKSPCLCNYYRHVADGVLPEEYALQVHAGMAICETDRWFFGSYFPNKPIFAKEVKRDAFTEKLHASLLAFKDLYEDRYNKLTNALDRLERGVA